MSQHNYKVYLEHVEASINERSSEASQPEFTLVSRWTFLWAVVVAVIMVKKGLLERLRDGAVIGDGGMVMALEKRGYVTAGAWTSEASVEHPEAVRHLHREFLRGGSDVMQTFTFYSTDDKLSYGGHEAGKKFTCSEISSAACQLAKEVAEEGDALVAGGVTQCPSYGEGKGKEFVQRQIRQQIQVFLDNKVDFIVCEFFNYVEEMEWAIEEAKKTGLPVAATMCISVTGDHAGVLPGQCAVRMAKAGADVVGVNCKYDPFMTLDTIKVMKAGLDAAGLKPYLMAQPNGFFTPGTGKGGYEECPEFPFAMEPRTVSRFDVHKYARAAYELGVRYIGGCCGFESYHIRAIAEELAKERGKLPLASAKNKPWGENNRLSSHPFIHKRVGREYWESIVPASGRPFPPTYALPTEP